MPDFKEIAMLFYPEYAGADYIMYSTEPISQMLTQLENNLVHYPVKYRKRTLFLFTELMQNIKKHQYGTVSGVLIWLSGNQITMAGINRVDENNRYAIIKSINTGKQLPEHRLKEEIKSRWQNPKAPGTGLLQMIKKTSTPPAVNFKKHKNQLFVSIKLQIYVN